MNKIFLERENRLEQLNLKTVDELIRQYQVSQQKDLMCKNLLKLKLSEKSKYDRSWDYFVKKFPTNFLATNNVPQGKIQDFFIELKQKFDIIFKQKFKIINYRFYFNELKFGVELKHKVTEKVLFLEMSKPKRVGWNNFKLYRYVDADKTKKKVLAEFQINSFDKLENSIESIFYDLYLL